MSHPRMVSLVPLTVLALVLTAPARAQGPDPGPARAELAKLHALLGRWEGEAWNQMGPRRDTLHQTERVESVLGGSAIMVEGIGSRPGSNPPDVRYHAIAMIVWDARSRGYKVHAFRDNALAIVADATLADSVFVWGFPDGRGGHVRYTLTLAPDSWHEVGEYSRDQQSWMKFSELNLRRVPGAPNP